MKILITLFMIPFFMVNKCNMEKMETLNSKIEYEVTRRGSYKKILIQNQKMFFSDKRDELGVEINVSDKDWQEIITLFEAVEAEKIEGLTGTNINRATDRASHAHFSIEKNGKKYSTNTFDHGNPPAILEKLVTKIASFLK